MTSTSVSFDQALKQHQAGRLNDAERLYQNILRIDPQHADALHLLGVVAHQQGRHAQAVECIRKAISINGPAAPALNNLGTAYRDLGKIDEAIDAFRKAVAVAPAFAGAHFNLALALEATGQIQQAITSYENALANDAGFLNAYVHLGRLFARENRFEDAIACFENALREEKHFLPALLSLAQTMQHLGNPEKAAEKYCQVLKRDPQQSEARQQLERILQSTAPHLFERVEELRKKTAQHPEDTGLRIDHAKALEELGRFGAAEQEYRQILTSNPTHGKACERLGDLLFERGALSESAECYRQATQSRPADATIFLKYANVLMDLGRIDQAIENYRRSVAINPQYHSGWYNLGNALRESEHYTEAEQCYRKTVEIDSGHRKARLNLGITLRQLGQLTESLACWDELLRSSPQDPQTHLQRALTLLSHGEFATGWQEYEWRWQAETRPRSFPEPTWSGETLTNQAILIHAEQGVGDEIMFASCIPDLIAQAGCCLIECDQRLVPLFSRSFPEAKVYGKPITRTPENEETDLRFDCQIPMGSLPRFVRRSTESFPQRKQYLVPDPEKVREWRERFDELGESLNVGVSWRGGKKPEVQRSRSTGLEQWQPVLNIPGVRFINLQYGDCREELTACKYNTGTIIHDWDDIDTFHDLDTFAAQIAALDLVISVDNSTVHLAGALGVATWTLLPFAADFRWMTATEKSLWYPGMRLFRQPEERDWDSVFADVAHDLSVLLKP